MLRNSVISQAGQVFENVTSGSVGKARDALAGIIPANSKLSGIFRGTSLDPANRDAAAAQVATASNTKETADGVKTLVDLATGKGASGGSGLSNPLAGLPISLPPAISSVPSSIAATITSVSKGEGRLSAISGALGDVFSGAGSVINGTALRTLMGYGVNVTPAERVGAGLGLAGAAAAGTYGVISGIHQGGAGGALKAAGSASGLVGSAVSNISKLVGAASSALKAIPVVGDIAALALPLVGSFFGQGPARRQNQLNQELSANQYIAPQALNVTMDPSGHFADFDARGNLRTSSFSAYPTVRQGMVWEQTHGLFGPPPTYYNVPGTQTSQFGPAAAPQPLIGTLHMNALDTQTGVDFLMKNSHTIASAGAKALQDGHGGFAAEVQRTAAVG